MPRRKRHQHEYPNSCLQSEKEDADFELFAEAYLVATGFELEVEGSETGTQDFTCSRSDGLTVGVELTELRRAPEDAFWERILQRRDEMEPWDAVDELWRLLGQKSKKKANYSTKYNIVLVLNCDADFRLLQSFAINVPYEDYQSLGLDEIWLGDYRGVRTGAHCSIALFGLYPNNIRELTERPGWDMKRFG